MEDDPFLRDPEVERETGLSRVTRWRKIKEGTFPAPVQLSANSIAWRKSAIDEWKRSRPTVQWAPKPEREAV